MPSRHRWFFKRQFFSYWLGSRTENAAALVQSADAITPLTDEAQRRFDGLAAWRDGHLDAAVELLGPLVFEDSIAGACLGAVQFERGDLKAAAVQYLLTARAFPGTLAGIWSDAPVGERSSTRRFPCGETATAVGAIVAGVSTHIDRYPTEPRLAVSVRLRPPERVIDPYQPILLDVSIMNMGTVPLSIGSDAPINSLMVLLVTLQVPYMTLPPPEPIIIDIGQRLRLQPREDFVVPIDLRGHWPLCGAGSPPVAGSEFQRQGDHQLSRVDLLQPAAASLHLLARAIGVGSQERRLSRRWCPRDTGVVHTGHCGGT